MNWLKENGRWAKKSLEVNLDAIRAKIDDIRFWYKSLNASVYNWTNSLDNIYPSIGSQYKKKDDTTWVLPLEEGPSNGQIAHFIPDRAIEEAPFEFIEVDYATYKQPINLSLSITNLRIDNQLLTIGNKILLLDQVIESENGVYLINNLFQLEKQSFSTKIITIIWVKSGRYNQNRVYKTDLDANGIPLNPFHLSETTQWLVRSKLEYKTNRTFTFRHILTGYDIVVGDNGLILNLSDNTISLTETRSQLNWITIDDSNTMWVCGNGGIILSSTDLGNTWTNTFLPTEANLNWIGTIGNYIITVGQRSTVFLSKDNGVNWTQIEVKRKWTKTLTHAYISLIDGVSYLNVVGAEGTLLIINLSTEEVIKIPLNSDLKNEAVLDNLQRIYPLHDGMIVMGNDTFGFVLKNKYYDLYPINYISTGTIEGDETGRTWAGMEVWADGLTQTVLYLFSSTGEIFTVTLSWDNIYSSAYYLSAPTLSSFVLTEQLNLSGSLIISVEPDENSWKLIGTQRGVWDVDYNTLVLTKNTNFYNLFVNRMLILDYFIARKMEVIVDNNPVIASATLPTTTPTSIEFKSSGVPSYFDLYRQNHPIENLLFSYTNTNNYLLSGLTSLATPSFVKPSGEILVGPVGINDTVNTIYLTGITNVDKFVEGTSALIKFDWLDGFNNLQNLIRTVEVISNDNGAIVIPRVIEDAPQLNTYAITGQLFLNPLRNIEGNFVLDTWACSYTGPSSFLGDTGDVLTLTVDKNGFISSQENFTISSKTSFNNADRFIFSESVSESVLEDLNEDIHFNNGAISLNNRNYYNGNLSEQISKHNIGSAYEITSTRINGLLNSITSFYSLTVDLEVKENSNVYQVQANYNESNTVWNPDYTLSNFLLSLDSSITLNTTFDVLKLNETNTISFLPGGVRQFKTQLLVKTNYSTEIENVLKRLGQSTFFINLSNGSNTCSVVVLSTQFIDGQDWLMVIGEPLPFTLDETLPTIISARIKLSEISSDLEWTDDIHLQTTNKDIFVSKVRYGELSNAILKHPIIKEKLTASLYLDANNNLVVNSIDVCNDPNYNIRPIDLFELGTDLLPKNPIKITEGNFNIINIDYKTRTDGGFPICRLVNVDKELLRYRLVDALTLQKLHDQYLWVLNAHMDNAVIGVDEYGIIFYKGDWLGGYFEGGRWVSGNWYNGIWQNGVFESQYVEDLYNYAIISEYDGKKSNWWEGTWKTGIFDGGTFWGGRFKNGTWNRGLWQNGKWFDGTFKSGIWRGGTWYRGTWDGGKFNGRNYRSVWKYGLWNGGDFENGLWLDGIWTSTSESPSRFGVDVNQYHRAIWRNGIWKDGQFMARYWNTKRKNYNQIWKYSTWENGQWENGHFVCGEFKKGEWRDGYFMDGVFGSSAVATIDAEWFNGHFKTGRWINGYWHRGLMESSLIMNIEWKTGDKGLKVKRARNRRKVKRQALHSRSTRNTNEILDYNTNPIEQLD